MIAKKYQSGFTAVELLITLFIAAAFLMSGYQLYSMIIRDGGEARARAKASNVAYEYLQIYKAKARSTCVSETIPSETPTIESLSDVTISGSITCPNLTETPSVSKISVTVSYNKPVQEVVNATYVSF